ncbi:PREDICTED: glycine-rich RNA-binding protein 6, mitochondrial [Tarenaya hassleriana]|uniref:glycine-rich RNA-binding protein 6, mitochondrial n=1 Tax=Tarenaya hassleriana TaxID=28532 RepID=UPI00053CA27A|nr:PREDICTED: glycine-rich RNA-binding protein 6, mitochondrial [Tarenaya hassleriana]
MAFRIPSVARSAVAAPGGLRRLFCSTSATFPFAPPQQNDAAPGRPQAEPSTNLFVSGLSKRTTSEGLRDAFAKFGQVADAKVVKDRVSGYSKGFGFVRYETIDDAAKGIEGMDGKFLDGWVIFAEYARPRQQPAPLQQNMSRPPYGNW